MYQKSKEQTIFYLEECKGTENKLHFNEFEVKKSNIKMALKWEW